MSLVKGLESSHFRDLRSPVLIIGSAHSGKSNMALDILDPAAKTMVFGTADPMESAFKPRIIELQTQRPAHWQTVEDNAHIAERIQDLDPATEQLLLDSLNQWVASRILSGLKKHSAHQLEALIQHEAETINKHLRTLSTKRILLITSEIACGITPPGEIPRLFRQMASRINCLFAKSCASVVLVSAGIPLLIKGELQARSI